MELRHLRAFCAVAQEMHVTKAAKRLKMAQPALTQQIRLLERDMGLQLILPCRARNQADAGRQLLP